MMNHLPEKKRILALDAARGFAVVGMYVQHFALNAFNASLVSGNTMVLFILCSGMSFSIMSSCAMRRGMEPEQFRAKVLARAACIDFLGYGLMLLNGPFAVILMAYAMLFMLALVLRNMTTKALAWASAGAFVVCPVVMVIGLSLFSGSAMLADLAGGPLSAAGMLPVFMVGMTLGRMELRDGHKALCCILLGVACIAAVWGLNASMLSQIREAVEGWMAKQPEYAVTVLDEYAPWPKNTWPVRWDILFAVAPQNGSSFTLMQGLGVALVVLGAMLMIERHTASLLIPFAKAGQVALSLYVAQTVIGWGLSLMGIQADLGVIPFGDIAVAILTVASGCALSLLPVGPVEGLLKRFEQTFVGKG